jgi:hypothetical protein
MQRPRGAGIFRSIASRLTKCYIIFYSPTMSEHSPPARPALINSARSYRRPDFLMCYSGVRHYWICQSSGVSRAIARRNLSVWMLFAVMNQAGVTCSCRNNLMNDECSNDDDSPSEIPLKAIYAPLHLPLALICTYVFAYRSQFILLLSHSNINSDITVIKRAVTCPPTISST